MAQAKSLSLSHFTTAVHSAVEAAVKKHPKFKLEAPSGISFSYLIRGFPVPDAILQNVTFGETQAFANEVAAQIGAKSGIAAEANLSGGQGAIYSAGKHIIIGIPAVEQILEK
jgi:hypothetical protein